MEDTQPILRSKPKRLQGDAFWNVLTLLVLVGMLCLAVSYAAIFFQPNLALNPFPPPTLPPTVVLPTSTATPRTFPPTWTPIPTQHPQLVSTPQPASTVEGPEATEVVVQTPPPVPEEEDPASKQPVAFILRAPPTSLASTRTHPTEGCSWLGIAGQAFDLQGMPVQGLLVNVGGTLNGETLSKTSLTGTEPLYGEAGYEIVLAREPLESIDTLWIQLADQANLPVSEKVYFSTSADCQHNLVLINFIATQ
jgi:hypothetical protein